MDPVYELQVAVVQRLRADTGVTALIGAKTYDNPPTNDDGEIAPSLFPYVSIGASSMTPDNAECIHADDIIFQLDVWSIDLPKKQMRDIAEAVRRALRDWEPTLSDNALVSFEYDGTTYIQDGNINHAAIRYTALIEQP